MTGDAVPVPPLIFNESEQAPSERPMVAEENTDNQKKFGNDVALSLQRNLHELQAKKSLEEHDLKNEINSLLRRIEQLEMRLETEQKLRIVRSHF